MSKKLLVLSLLSVLLLITISQTPSVNAVTVTIAHKGHYIIEWISDPETVDPAWAYDTSSGEIITNVYETLISFDREHTDQFVPTLSRNVPSLADNTIQYITETDPETGLVWQERLIFHIRLTDANGDPILFHSGNPLTMADIEYSFERWMVQDRSGGPEWMIYEATEGIGNYHAFHITDDPVVQGKIVDHAFQVSGDDFIINLAVAYAPILGILAQYWASILDKAYIVSHVPADWDGVWGDYTEWVDHHDPPESPLDTAGNLMSGTGPYAGPGPYTNPTYGIGYWTHGVEWSIVRFEDYWRGWNPEVLDSNNSDFLYRVTEKVVYEWSFRLTDFRAGTCDTAYVPRQRIDDVRGWPGIRGFPDLPPGNTLPPGQFWGLPTLSADAMFFNEAIDPVSPYVGSGALDGNGIPLDFFSDLHIRKAFAYLFDADTFLSQVWLGEAIQPSSPVKPEIPYSIEVPKYEYSLTKAAEEFQAASADPASPAYQVWDKGFYFKMTYNTGNWPRGILTDMIKKAAYAINPKFIIGIVGVTWSTYLGELWWYPSYRSILPIFMIDKFTDYPDPHNWVFPFMHTDGEFSHPTSYSNPTVDELIEEGIATPDGPERAAIYAQLQMLYYLDVPSVMLAEPLARRWERDWVQGWYYNPLLAVSSESASGPYYYYMWEGLNGDYDGDGHVYATDVGRINAYLYDPPLLYGPNTIAEGYAYRVKYDNIPALQYQIGMLPPPGYSVGRIDILDLAVFNIHFDEQTDP